MLVKSLFEAPHETFAQYSLQPGNLTPIIGNLAITPAFMHSDDYKASPNRLQQGKLLGVKP